MNKLKWDMAGVLLALALSGAIGGKYSDFLFPFTEWVTTLLYVNYFAILSFTNNYYDSVHPFDSNVAKKQEVTVDNSFCVSNISTE